MAIHEPGEDYLEAILMIKKRNGNVRSIDIAHELSFSKPSVSVAMKNLKASNYITIDENGFINLTQDQAKVFPSGFHPYCGHMPEKSLDPFLVCNFSVYAPAK